MQRKLFTALVFSSFVLIHSPFAYAELENLDTLKKELIYYHDSGEYAHDIAKVDSKALDYLKQRVAEAKPPEKLAIVLDIDETSLSNYRDMLAMNFGGSLNQIMAEENKGTDAAIKPTLEIYHYAKAHGIAVFFITGRTKNYRAATSRNLEAVGYKNFDGVTLKPVDYHEKSVVPYKSSARKTIADAGYTIILNVGDQESDLDGGYAEKTFKLPNPYYYIN